MKPRYKVKTPAERVHRTTKSEKQREARTKIIQAKKNFKKRSPPRKNYSLRYIGIILRYMSVRHGFIKRELEVILYLYSLAEFTKEDFDKAVSLIYGSHSRMLRRFTDLGYIKEERRPVYFERKKPELHKTGKLVLSKQVVLIVRHFYKIYNQIMELDKNPDAVDISPRVMAFLNTMDREVEDIESGRKKADEIIKTDDYEKQ